MQCCISVQRICTSHLFSHQNSRETAPVETPDCPFSASPPFTFKHVPLRNTGPRHGSLLALAALPGCLQDWVAPDIWPLWLWGFQVHVRIQGKSRTTPPTIYETKKGGVWLWDSEIEWEQIELLLCYSSCSLAHVPQMWSLDSGLVSLLSHRRMTHLADREIMRQLHFCWAVAAAWLRAPQNVKVAKSQLLTRNHNSKLISKHNYETASLGEHLFRHFCIMPWQVISY